MDGPNGIHCTPGPLFEGAVSEADWGSALRWFFRCAQPEEHSLRLAWRRATSLFEGGERAARWTAPTKKSIVTVFNHTDYNKYNTMNKLL